MYFTNRLCLFRAVKKEPSRWGRNSGRDSEVGLLTKEVKENRFPMGTAHVRKESDFMTQVAFAHDQLAFIIAKIVPKVKMPWE